MKTRPSYPSLRSRRSLNSDRCFADATALVTDSHHPEQEEQVEEIPRLLALLQRGPVGRQQRELKDRHQEVRLD